MSNEIKNEEQNNEEPIIQENDENQQDKIVENVTIEDEESSNEVQEVQLGIDQDNAQLKENQLDTLAKEVVDDNLDYISELDDDLNFDNKNQDEIKKAIKKQNSRRKILAERQKTFLLDNGFKLKGSDVIHDNKKVMKLKRNPLTRSVRQAMLGPSPSPEEIVAGLMLVKDKHIANFPYSEQGVQNFETALKEIVEKDYLDIDKITIDEDVDQAFKDALERVKNDTVKLGFDNKVDTPKNDLTSENNARIGKDDSEDKKPSKKNTVLDDSRAEALNDITDETEQQLQENVSNKNKSQNKNKLRR